MAEFETYAPGTPSWVDLAWSDPTAAAAFYTDVFGWELQTLGPEAGGYAMFTKNGKLVAGCGPKMMGDAQPSAWTTFVSVSDAEATAASITAAGGTVLAGPMKVLDAGTMTVFQAPDTSYGATWEPASHTGAQLANEPGTFCWNELVSRDPEASSAFYGSVFGWGVTAADMGGTPYTLFDLDGAQIAGMTPAPAELPPNVPSYWLVYFAVEDVDATYAHATAHGASAMLEPMDSPVGRFGILLDPERAAFAMIELGGAS